MTTDRRFILSASYFCEKYKITIILEDFQDIINIRTAISNGYAISRQREHRLVMVLYSSLLIKLNNLEVISLTVIMIKA